MRANFKNVPTTTTVQQNKLAIGRIIFLKKKATITQQNKVLIRSQIIKNPLTTRIKKSYQLGAKLEITQNNKNKKNKAANWEANCKNNHKQQERKKEAAAN